MTHSAKSLIWAQLRTLYSQRPFVLWSLVLLLIITLYLRVAEPFIQYLSDLQVYTKNATLAEKHFVNALMKNKQELFTKERQLKMLASIGRDTEEMRNINNLISDIKKAVKTAGLGIIKVNNKSIVKKSNLTENTISFEITGKPREIIKFIQTFHIKSSDIFFKEYQIFLVQSSSLSNDQLKLNLTFASFRD